jgi:microcystin-dependent protein
MSNPIVPPPPRSASSLADAMVQTTNQAQVLRRWGLVNKINSDGTLDVDIAGVVVPKLKRVASYNPTAGERVLIDAVGTDLTVIGATAPSPKNSNLRTATVTAIAANGTLTLRFDDTTIVAGVQRMAIYNPVVNDTVQVMQTGYAGTYLVLGPVAGTIQPHLRRPVGDVEPTIRKTAKPGTLLLQGQTVKRTDYPTLFAWVQDQGLLSTATVPNLFGLGDGTTTFVLPDLRGRVLSGADATNVLGALFGANSRTTTLTVDNLPTHDHNVAVGMHGDHDHNATTASSGGHSGHNLGSVSAASALPGYQDFAFSVAASTQNGGGGHVHGVDVFLTENTGSHRTHAVTEQAVGTNKAFDIDVRQPSYAVNYLIWI